MNDCFNIKNANPQSIIAEHHNEQEFKYSKQVKLQLLLKFGYF